MKNNCRLSPLALGLSLGVFWAVCLLIMGLLASYAAYGGDFVSGMASVYWGYEPTVLGSIIGAAYGFIDGLISGAIVAWLYNLFGGCRACHPKEKKE